MNLDRYIPLGVDADTRTNLDGWLMSEKLDGCRAVWDGNVMWSRGGRKISIPPRIRRQLPIGRRLDGELWAGRGKFEVARVAVQYGRFTPCCRFTAFDCPDASGTWSDRIAEAGRLYSDVVSYSVCQDWRHANAMLFEVQAACGEGLVARHPTAMGYERGRTENFVKFKEPLL